MSTSSVLEIQERYIDNGSIVYTISDKQYLFDPASTGLFAITEAAFEALLSERIEDQTVAEQFGNLKAKGYFTEPGIPLINDRATKISGQISEITLGLTNQCNFHCRYCFGRNYLRQNEDPETVLKVGFRCLDILYRNMRLREDDKTSSHPRVYSLIFFGGEPLIRFDLIKKTVEYGVDLFGEKRDRLHFGITTNASLLDSEVVDFFIKHEITPLISIDGSPDIHDANRIFRNGRGSYAKVAQNLRNAARKGLPLGSRITINRVCPNVVSVLEGLGDLGFFSNKLSLVSGPDQLAIQNEELDCLLRSMERLAQIFVGQIKTGQRVSSNFFDHYLTVLLTGNAYDTGCGIGRNGISVATDGSVFSCYKLAGEPETAMGNIFDEEILARRPGVDFAFEVQNIPDCLPCKVRHICAGGCFADRYLSDKYQSHLALKNRCLVERYKLKLVVWIISQMDHQAMVKLYQYLKQ